MHFEHWFEFVPRHSEQAWKHWIHWPLPIIQFVPWQLQIPVPAAIAMVDLHVVQMLGSELEQVAQEKWHPIHTPSLSLIENPSLQ